MQRLFLGSFIGMSLLLVAIVGGIGFWVDPFAHFTPADQGFDRSSAYTLNRSLFRSVEFQKLADEVAARGGHLNIIIGDSMGNQIDQKLVSDGTGEVWFNYSYGQASLTENIVLLRALLDHGYPIRRIAWSLAFPRMRSGDKDEMTRSLEMVRYPIWHLFTFESLRGAYYVLRKAWSGIDLTDLRLDLDQADSVEYFGQRMQMDMLDVAWPAEALATVEQLERSAAAKGIELTYALLPVHPKTSELFETAFADRYRRYLDFIGRRCLIDLRDRSGEGPWPGDMFRDAVHLLPDYRPELSRRFAQELRQPCRSPATVASPGSRTAMPAVLE